MIQGLYFHHKLPLRNQIDSLKKICYICSNNRQIIVECLISMPNPSPDVRFNLAASSTDGALSFLGRYIPFWTNQAERNGSSMEEKAKDTDRHTWGYIKISHHFLSLLHQLCSTFCSFVFLSLTKLGIFTVETMDINMKLMFMLAFLYEDYIIFWLPVKSLCINMHHEFKANLKKKEIIYCQE